MFRKILLVISVSVFLTGAIYAQDSAKPSGISTKTSTSDKPKRAPIFSPTKSQIEQVQNILKGKKLYDGEPSGKYDDGTRAGIRTFQKGNGLKETGTLNRATLEKFGVDLTDSQKKIPVSPNSFAGSGDTKKPSKSGSYDKSKRAAPFRANKEQVTAAQKLLKQQSMYTGEATGKLDDPTREGLKKYQAAKSMKVTGTLNAATLQKMGIELTDKQTADAAAHL